MPAKLQTNSQCKICRRAGIKLFLKGEKCNSPKCTIIRKPYVPGPKKKRRTRQLSEYGKELREKQKLKNWYNLRERQFRNYVELALESRRKVENAEFYLIKILESRLDNLVYRMGFALSREMARQIVSHRHITVNGKIVNIPSLQVKKGDVIGLNPKSVDKNAFKNLSDTLKKHKAVSWIALNADKKEGKIVTDPIIDEVIPPAEISSIFEFYSR